MSLTTRASIDVMTSPHQASVQAFINSRTILTPGRFVELQELYGEYVKFCVADDWEPAKPIGFGMILTGLGFGTARTATRRYRTGLSLPQRP